MKIHLQSDIHLEMYANRGYTVFPDAPICDTIVVAGDMCTMIHPEIATEYFIHLRQYCDNIIWVLGNHEFYHNTYEDTIDEAVRIAKYNNVHLLDIETSPSVEIDGVKFWGSTLWTDLNKNDYRIAGHVRDGLNDYHVIKKGDRKLHTNDTFDIYKRTVEQIDWDADVIVTHHCPIGLKHSRFSYSAISHGFVSYDVDLQQKIEDSNVKYWFYGHTHDNVTTEINKTLIISNQVGYPHEDNVSFDPTLILEA